MSTRGVLAVGTSGWQYSHWRGVFYPPDLPQSKWFAFYAARFDVVEVNNTFYRLPPEQVFGRWRTAAPKGFCYALKFSRYGSHMRKLKDAPDTIGLFLERARLLGEHLGPILVQLPPKWRADAGRLDEFLAARPAGERWAVEFRDPSWLTAEVLSVLRRHGAALCIHDMIADHPHELTADWTYLRFHGVHYGGSYSPRALHDAAREIRRLLAAGVDVHAYFNNDAQGFAVANALELRRNVLEG
jgi:uncharacterized protein YecE (DUF72 family)